MMAVAAISLLAACILGQDPAGAAPSGYQIAGTVVEAGSGEPMPFVRVMLDDPNRRTRDPLAWVKTGGDGKFAFTVAKPGLYSLSATHRGAVRMYGGGNLGPGVSVLAGPGQDTSGLRFAFLRPAAISGRVIDAGTGEGLQDAMVQVYRAGVVNGTRRLVRVTTRRTDERGFYRAGNLPAGPHFLVVTANARQEEGQAYAPAYYPSPPSLRPGAQAVPLAPGQEASADFTLTRGPGTSVSIEMEGKPSRQSVLLDLISTDLEEVESAQSTKWFYGVENYSGVPAGNYRLRVRDRVRTLLEKTVTISGPTQRIVLPAVPPALPVSGSATFVGPTPKRLVTIQFRDRRDRVAHSVPLEVTPDGKARFGSEGLLPGAYRIDVLSSEGYHVLPGVKVEGASLDARNHFEVEEGSTAIRVAIRLSNSRGSLAGTVVDGEGKARAGVQVLVFHENRRDEEGYAFAFVSDSDGSFVFRNIPSGAYTLVAVDASEIAYHDPVELRKYRPLGRKVTVREKAREEAGNVVAIEPR